ncbi:flagellar assembly peptidoglycan hydrolase FlgJ [Pseudomonas sp. LF245]
MKSSDHFALDVQGLDHLRNRAHLDPQAGLKEASKQFEAVFIQMMLKSMRAAVPKSELSSNSQTEMYTEMLDQQWAQSLSGKGIGLAEQLTRQLSGYASQQNPELSAATTAFLDLPTRSPFEAWKRREVSTSNSDQPEHVQAFIARLSGPAQTAARNSGVPAELILAQAALETDWGRRTITTAQGADSHNLFGIKAGSAWQGATTQVLTTEYSDAAAQKQLESFRVYASDEAAFSDYARLMRSRPGYAAVRTAGDAPQAAVALQQGGYATDPRYAQKLISVMATIGPLHTTQARNDL